MINPGEPTIVCPYERSHVLLKSRVQTHLAKCRLQHTQMEKIKCPYNLCHVINKVELTLHMDTCPDRRNVELFVHNVGNKEVPVKLHPVRDIPLNHVTEDDWDEAPSVSILDAIKKSAQSKPIMIGLVGASKAAKRSHRNQERARYEKYLNSNEPSNI